MALNVEDREKVRSALMSALINISRKYQAVTAPEIKQLFNEVMQELERRGQIKRGGLSDEDSSTTHSAHCP